MLISAKSTCALLAFALAATSMGCAVDSGDEVGHTARGTTTLTSSFEEGTVEGEMKADGDVTATAKDVNGQALLSLTVHGDRVQIEPLGDSSIAARTIIVPGDANATNTLEDWNFHAYAYSQHVVGGRPARDASGTRPQQRITGASCIAAGGTAMQCWFYIAFLM
jgi:hypothetical protein